MVILVDVKARSRLDDLTVLSDDAVDDDDADTLLTTDDTIERSTVHARQPLHCAAAYDSAMRGPWWHSLFSCKASNLGSASVLSSKSA
jgi:hypothetical protein